MRTGELYGSRAVHYGDNRVSHRKFYQRVETFKGGRMGAIGAHSGQPSTIKI